MKAQVCYNFPTFTLLASGRARVLTINLYIALPPIAVPKEMLTTWHNFVRFNEQRLMEAFGFLKHRI